jgi:hypothetical protein
VVNPYHMSVTYWDAGVSDGYGGVMFGAPKVWKGRWEDRQEQYLNPQMEEKLSAAVVFLPSNCTPKIGGFLLNGASKETDPSKAGAYEIKQVLSIPDLRNVKMELRVVL